MGWASSNGLLVPERLSKRDQESFKDLKNKMAQGLKDAVDQTLKRNEHRKDPYFIVFHGKFDEIDPSKLRRGCFTTPRMPQFITNQIVFWVSNQLSLAVWLWSVSHDQKITFNKEGVAQLQKKGAMPTA